ncbi:hypothetical protein [Wenzhouxiangella marina]|uniref:Secreted TPR-repeat containing protein n=1 Tax=Wenzhouxiangella marina TaxID=1579979 RepID=A0A0K0XYK8_9GAMM|nr:hypothetical protein [Wenzhouxiangella marina]AKS42706.1 Secreted TPR-repeat containing protein [Wenzhouxiangella marina]MBB6088605.1 tetratricopeptide (TPR) repeat protein [Wenzhouxiangella marina]
MTRWILPVGLLLCILVHGEVHATSEDGEAAAELGRAAELLDSDLDAAEDAIERALEMAPDEPEVQFMCGRVMGRKAEDSVLRALSYARRSLRCLERAAQLRPEHIPYRRGLMAFYLGAPGIAGGDESLALEQVEAIEVLDPVEGVLARVDYLYAIDETEGVGDLLAASRQRYPEASVLHFRHGLWLQQREEYAQAHAAFVQGRAPLSLGESPEDLAPALNALYQIGRNALFSESRVDEGIDALREYVSLELPAAGVPELEWAYLRLAQLHLLAGDHQEAGRYAQLAAALEDQRLQSVLRDLSLD